MMSYNLFSDDELLLLLGKGEKGAFTEIYNRYWKNLLSVAAHKTGDLDEAEEIVQDIFVSLWNRRNALQIRSSLKNYLSVSVKYKVIKVLAKQNSRHDFADEDLSGQVFLDDSTQEYLDFEDLQYQLSKLVAALPEKCRLVYKLSRDAGYTQKEIAAEMGISEKTVEAHLGKALKTIRNGLNQFLFTFLL